MTKIQRCPYGAVGGTVTGSLHIYESGQVGDHDYNETVIDCGIFQGENDLAEMNSKKARGLDVINKISEGNPSFLFTHGHIDHLGFIAEVVRRGHVPTVYTTEETKKIIEMNLIRSVKAQKGSRFVDDFACSMRDVGDIVSNIKKVEPFVEVPVTRDKKIKAVFCPNGHIIGSSSILIKDKTRDKNILFTGDVSRPDQLMTGGYNRYADKYPQDSIQVIMTESTCYPDKVVPFEKRIASFSNEVNSAFKRGSTILMPCIQHRQMEYIEIIRNCQKEGMISKNIEFVRDGPALVDIANLYKDLEPDYLSKRYGDNSNFYDTGSSQLRFKLDNLKTIRKHQDSILFANSIKNRRNKTIIFASGGMGEQGRVSNYFREGFLEDSRNTVIFSCYQVEGTFGADLLKQQNKTGYRGATIIKLEGGSSHATGKDEVFGYLKRFNLESLETIIICHGSETSRKSMEEGLRQTEFAKDTDIRLPGIGERVDLV